MLKFLIFLTIFPILVISEQCKDTMITCPDVKQNCDQLNVQSECPLTCGICSPDPNICDDTNLNCASIVTMCYMDQYKKQCPKTCGVCGGTTVAECVDHLVECQSYSTPCPANLIEKCPVTCGVCGNVTTTVSLVRTTVTLQTTKTTKMVPTTPKTPCKDASPNCGAWAKNGFCTNTFYPPEKRKEYCAKTCKFC